ncbi:MAG: enoyl-CoA hydratase/isomerase family protein, partial [Pseudomonadota bacterium]
MTITTETSPDRYRHWRLTTSGPVATLTMDVDPTGGLFDGYQLKLNSYDLGVDIELADAITRLRFENPEVKAVILRSGNDRVFSAGANIRMLAGADHAHKVNFCKFTNETRNLMETSGSEAGQFFVCAIEGSCAGGGYELALACDWIILVDDGSSNVALPEAPLLAVLPGTGGLTRLTDKRRVRRDLADVFCTMEEGARGQRALDWKLVDEVVAKTGFADAVTVRANEFAARSHRSGASGIALNPLQKNLGTDTVVYSAVEVSIDRKSGYAYVVISGPDSDAPGSPGELTAEGAEAWVLRTARELDDAILHLRLNEPGIGVITFGSQGDPARVI